RGAPCPCRALELGEEPCVGPLRLGESGPAIWPVRRGGACNCAAAHRPRPGDRVRSDPPGVSFSESGFRCQILLPPDAETCERCALRSALPKSVRVEAFGAQVTSASATSVGVSGRSGEPWLRFVWSCRERPDPAGRRRVQRSVYLHLYFPRTPNDQATRLSRRSARSRISCSSAPLCRTASIS